jgi:hypothetical protein
MSKRTRRLIGVAAFVASTVPALSAQAQCCPGYSLATACSGVTLTRSRWCIQDTAPTGQSALPAAFCSYGDKVVTTLEKTFNIQAPDTFEFELDTQTGGALTGTACNHFGDGVAYDAFVGSAWGYLLALHEAINDWTGLSSSGWPTDWWADHQSAFPNLMDFHVMNTLGTVNNDQNLIKAAAAQKKRFYPGGDSADAKVVALDNVYLAMPNGDGFAGFSHMFSLQSGDGVKWDSLGVPNPDVKRSEYVVAYISLATGKSVLKLLQGPGANGGGNICNNTPDGTNGDAPYTCSEAHIDAIATAHCSIAANNKPSASLSALRSSNYGSIASGPCGSSCPSECACDSANHCVAPWLASTSTGGGGNGGGGATNSGGGGATSTGGGGAANTGGGGATSSGGGTTSSGGALAMGGGGATSSAGALGSGGFTSSGGFTGNGGVTGNAGATGLGGKTGSGGALSAGGSTATSGGGSATPTDSSSGCSCRAVGDGHGASRFAGLLLASVFAGLGSARTRARRRARRQ